MAGLRQNGVTRNGPTDMEVVGSLEPRKIWKRIRKHAAHGDSPALSLSLLSSFLHVQSRQLALSHGCKFREQTCGMLQLSGRLSRLSYIRCAVGCLVVIYSI